MMTDDDGPWAMLPPRCCSHSWN